MTHVLGRIRILVDGEDPGVLGVLAVEGQEVAAIPSKERALLVDGPCEDSASSSEFSPATSAVSTS